MMHWVVREVEKRFPEVLTFGNELIALGKAAGGVYVYLCDYMCICVFVIFFFSFLKGSEWEERKRYDGGWEK